MTEPISWTGRMIAADDEFNGAPVLYRCVELEGGHGPVAEAALTATALGVVTPLIDGRPATDELLTPGWTSYEWRLRYREWDVTALLGDRFELALALGNGWRRGKLSWLGARNVYGDQLAGFAQLRIRFADGHEQLVVTDETWQAHAGDVLANDLYDGEHIDARLRDSEAATAAVHAVAFDVTQLEPFEAPPVRPLLEVKPERIWTSPSGRTLVDFGQNLVGWVRCVVRGPRGETITIRHAEVLEHDELGTRPLRTAEATDRFTLSGGDDVFEPTLTFHGFRYAEVDGWPGGAEAIGEGALTAVVIGSDIPASGSFASSDPLLNRLHANVVWGMRGNFLSVPTDCPQRDERLGWTGDIAVFAPTAAFLGDVSGFLGDWLRDLDLEQQNADGVVPFVVPDVLKHVVSGSEFPPQDSTAIWGDAAAWVPWALWRAYGDRTALARQYPAMARHARRVGTLLAPDGAWDSGFQFGDWLDPDAPPDRPADAKADTAVVATACAYRTARMLADAAAVLDLADDAAEFEALAARIRSGFRVRYVSAAGGRVHSDAPTVYVLAIVFGLLDESEQMAAGTRLAELVAASGFHISTGFAGTPFITDALSETGQLETAYRLLLQRECPSWLYPVTMGATTIWERWDSMLPDGAINPGEMTSFNHYALGAVADWLHRVVAGIAPLEPGYRVIRFAPRPGGGIEWAAASHRSPFGLVAVRWELRDGTLSVEASVPAGAAGVLDLPGRASVSLAPGEHRFEVPFGAGA
ncbi:alpha-L-rhamnosidase [Gryllotalpicola koreensis]|uniref:alpha-L-rhamnosidase n=1 Tax=Gryllotalpicola koreensis TaxID=993086 RepID=A0ABP7ZSS0_9MICO